MGHLWSPKRVEFIAVTGLGFWNKTDGEGEALQSAFTFNVGRVVVVGVARSSCVASLCVASLRVVSLSVAASLSVAEGSYPYTVCCETEDDVVYWYLIQ